MTVGQRHYVVAKVDGRAYAYWRSRGNQWQPSGWVYDMAEARRYRKPQDALRAAQQVAAEPGDRVEVLELSTAVSRVCYRLETHATITEWPT